MDIERLKYDESLWPEGATHYCEQSGKFGLEREAMRCCCIPRPEPCLARWGDSPLPRPKVSLPAWDGIGLPPVGAVVEGNMPSWRDGWTQCRVIAHDNKSCVVVSGIGLPESWTQLAWCDNFRPIYTKEQKNRDDLVNFICDNVKLSRLDMAAALADDILAHYKVEPKE